MIYYNNSNNKYNRIILNNYISYTHFKRKNLEIIYNNNSGIVSDVS